MKFEPIMSEEDSEDFLRPAQINMFYFYLFSLIIVSNLWTLLMTTIPVFVDAGPSNYFVSERHWYTGNDVVRFLEPIGGFLFNFFIFEKSGIFLRQRTNLVTTCIVVFLFGSALFGQGAGFHSASNMFKHSTESVMSHHNDDVVKKQYYWMRTVWEHEVSHYLYATGYALIAAAQAWAYKDHVIRLEAIDQRNRVLLVIAAVVYGVLLAAVAAEFPSGVIVMLCYLVAYGGGVIGVYTWCRDCAQGVRLEYFGSRPLLHYFLTSYAVALVLTLAWIGFTGGLYTRSQSGL